MSRALWIVIRSKTVYFLFLLHFLAAFDSYMIKINDEIEFYLQSRIISVPTSRVSFPHKYRWTKFLFFFVRIQWCVINQWSAHVANETSRAKFENIHIPQHTKKYVNVTLAQVHTYTTLPIYSSYPTVLHHSIPYVAHKRLVTGTRISTTPSRVITRVISSPVRGLTPFRAYTPIRGYTPIRSITPIRYTNPITSVSVLSAPSRYIHSYTARTSTSPSRTTFSVRVRPSIINREFKRIENKLRSTPYHSHTENFLNSEVSRVSWAAKSLWLFRIGKCAAILFVHIKSQPLSL